MTTHRIFITGGTGYIGKRLIPVLLKAGHEVRALVRKGSEHKLDPGVQAVIGNALDASTYSDSVNGCDLFIHLVGVAHPSPAKKVQFITIDLQSAVEAAQAAEKAGIRKFIYLSVCMREIPVMADYREARKKGESFILSRKIPYVFIRPWYVVGPGHYWPLLFLPIFKLLEWIPSTAATARAIRLVSLPRVINAIARAVANEKVNYAIEISDMRN